MANVYLQDSTLTSIGNAIREKTGESSLLLPSQMPAAIQAITGGGSPDDFLYYNLTARMSSTDGVYVKWSDYFTDFDKLVGVTVEWGRRGVVACMTEHTFSKVYSSQQCPAQLWDNEGTIFTSQPGKISFLTTYEGTGILISTESNMTPTYSGSTGAVSFIIRK